jgi:hypothetical protein
MDEPGRRPAFAALPRLGFAVCRAFPGLRLPLRRFTEPSGEA